MHRALAIPFFGLLLFGTTIAVAPTSSAQQCPMTNVLSGGCCPGLTMCYCWTCPIIVDCGVSHAVSAAPVGAVDRADICDVGGWVCTEYVVSTAGTVGCDKTETFDRTLA